MASAALRLARAVLEDPDEARTLASRLISADRQRQARVRVKAAPRVNQKRADKMHRREMDAEVRAFVFKRAGGACEACRQVPPVEWHHLVPGSMRRTYGTVTGTLALCFACHREWHNGFAPVLQLSYDAAVRIGAPDVVLANLNRRIQKATAPRPADTKEEP